MADPEHVEVLRRGGDVWNAWRKAHPDVVPDLQEADLRGIHLARANLEGANLVSAYLPGADLGDANLRGANLTGRYKEDDLEEEDPHSLLDGAILRRASLLGANLSRANLAYAVLEGATLCYVDLRNTTLTYTRMRKADLTGADLRGVDLSYTQLKESILMYANLQNAILAPNMEGANLAGADLCKADFRHCHFSNTLFVDVDLSTARNLEFCQHRGPSVIDHRTLLKSGNLPLAFLRGCGLPDIMIDYLPSLLNQAIQFYSCFISYTEADDAFAERLYNDLQRARIRCWRWKEDAKWGRSLIGEIDKAVRLHDKLVVVCSEESLQSKAVIREIERALQREDHLYKRGEASEVLFPIRIDDYVFNGWDHPRKADILERNIGDFRSWRSYPDYQASLDRLMRDLKIEQQWQVGV